jgi:hypothetical protein
MATTTNYSWETPDDTDLVKDGASAIRTLGSSIDTTTKNLNPSTTLGDIEYRSSTANVNTRLGIGSSGQVLTVSGGVPAWTTPAGGGKVLQVVQQVLTTNTTVASTTFTDSGLTLSITPSSTSSKIMVIASVQFGYYRGVNAAGGSLNIMRGATQVLETNGMRVYVNNNANNAAANSAMQSLVYLDSPSTTSSTTYKVQMKSESTAQSAFCEINGDDYGTATSTLTLMEIGA